MRPALIGLCLWSVIALPVTAQQLPTSWVPHAAAFHSPQPAAGLASDSPVRSSNERALGAILGGVGGMALGAEVGYGLDRGSGPCDDFCGIGGFVIGGLLGESLGMVAGATLADPNGTRASDWLTVPAITLAGTALAAVSGRVEVMLLIPVTQLIALMSHDETPTADGALPEP